MYRFNEKMAKYGVQTNIPEAKPEFDVNDRCVILRKKMKLFFCCNFQLEFEFDQQAQRIALGQGTYGKVYVAQDRITWKKFAVKEIPMRNPNYTEDLENEIKILSTLNHKNSSSSICFNK